MDVCEIHLGVHRPDQLDGPDRHHTLPREFQRHWQPVAAPYPGTYAGEKLWDAREVKLPPTCHHNVHHWIVTIMRALAARPDPTLTINDVLIVVAGLQKAVRSKWHRLEIVQAQEAPIRFLQAGGDLRVLTNAHLWGAI